MTTDLKSTLVCLLLVFVAVICVDYCVQAVMISIPSDKDYYYMKEKQYIIFSVENDVLTFVAALLCAIAVIAIKVVSFVANWLLDKVQQDMRKTIETTKMVCAFAPLGIAVLWAVVTTVYIVRKNIAEETGKLKKRIHYQMVDICFGLSLIGLSVGAVVLQFIPFGQSQAQEGDGRTTPAKAEAATIEAAQSKPQQTPQTEPPKHQLKLIEPPETETPRTQSKESAGLPTEV